MITTSNLISFLIVTFYSFLIFLLVIIFITTIVCFRWYYYSVIRKLVKLDKSCLYLGKVKHTRLKGGAIHHIQYPIFFSYLNLEEVEKIEWLLYPLFKVNGSWTAFCSLDYSDHLKGWNTTSNSLIKRLDTYIKETSQNKLNIDENKSSICLLTHLTYFGYCFNPVSFYYIFDNTTNLIHAIVAEVGNTPWNEQHSYVLHEDVPNVTIHRSNNDSDSKAILSTFEASWFKDFHVSPFMEMDYKYNFMFSIPTEKIHVRSKMIKTTTNEIWFTAHFELERLSFTPLNLLYVLIFYPLHTRMIQFWIHLEAVKIYLKGIPTFEHPHGTDVNFGFGITGKKLLYVYELISAPIFSFNRYMCNIITTYFSKEKKND